MRNSTVKPNRQIIAEASAWLIEFRTEHPSQVQRDRFNAWLRTSPQHIQAYFEVAAAWSELPDSDPGQRLQIDAMIAAANATTDNVVELGARISPAAPRMNFKPSSKVATLAATLLIATGAGAWLYTQQGIYSTTTGEQHSLTLADGTNIELNAQTKIRVRYSDTERHIDLLRGQALFHVAKSRTRPFIVDVLPAKEGSPSTQVRAVGTQFDVYRKSTATIVTVIEGKVAVLATGKERVRSGQGAVASDAADPANGAKGANEAFLAAGQQLTVSGAITASAGMKKNADIAAATAWTQKRLAFEETPLSDVAEEFNRYNFRRLVIADAELQRLAISGLYSSTDPTSLIEFLRTQPRIAVDQTDDEIRITRRKDPL